MWINLEREELEFIAQRLGGSLDQPAANIEMKIEEAIANGFDPANGFWVESAKSRHQDEGQIEIDEQGDGSAMVSIGEDGAYVMAWAFVPFSDESKDEDEVCDDCDCGGYDCRGQENVDG